MNAPSLTLRKLRARDVVFEVIVEPEQDPVAGHFATGDVAADAAIEREIIESFNSGNVEAWCSITVKATWQSIEGTDHLGCCSHLPGKGLPSLDEQVESTVRDHGMREQALADLNYQIRQTAERGLELINRLTVKPRAPKKARRGGGK